MKSKARELLFLTGRYAGMYASNCEAYLSRVTAILEMADCKFSAVDFYTSHLKTKGNTFVSHLDPVKAEWAKQVVDDAISLLDKETT